MESKQKETFAYTHKDITVYVRIDYVNNIIDIVEQTGNGDFRKKDYTFIGRGVEYMNGWKDILEAISKTIDHAKKKYETNLAEVSRIKQDKMLDYIIEGGKSSSRVKRKK